jgi:hypothetical protein
LYLDSVELGWVVARGDHYAAVEAEVPDKVLEDWSRHGAHVVDVAADAEESRYDGVPEHGAAGAAVHAYSHLPA